MSYYTLFQHVRKTYLAFKEKGLKEFLTDYYYFTKVKHGRLVGTDAAGNKYYEDEGYQTGELFPSLFPCVLRSSVSEVSDFEGGKVIAV